MQHLCFVAVEAGFFVFLIAGEFLADVVLVGGVFEAGVARAAADARIKLLAKGHEVPPGLHLPKLVRDHPRRSEMVCRGVGNARRLRKLRRILRNELTGGIDENGCLGVGFLLDAFAFVIVEIPADGHAVAFNFRLLVVAVEDELPRERSERVNIGNDIAVRVIPKALPGVEAVRVWVNGRVRGIGVSGNVLCKPDAIAVAVVAPRLAPVRR